MRPSSCRIGTATVMHSRGVDRIRYVSSSRLISSATLRSCSWATSHALWFIMPHSRQSACPARRGGNAGAGRGKVPLSEEFPEDLLRELRVGAALGQLHDAADQGLDGD